MLNIKFDIFGKGSLFFQFVNLTPFYNSEIFFKKAVEKIKREFSDRIIFSSIYGIEEYNNILESCGFRRFFIKEKSLMVYKLSNGE